LDAIILVRVNASRKFNPSASSTYQSAGHVHHPADDFINPPELGMAEREIKKVKNALLFC